MFQKKQKNKNQEPKAENWDIVLNFKKIINKCNISMGKNNFIKDIFGKIEKI